MIKRIVYVISLILFSACVCSAAKVEIGKNKEIIVNGKPFFPIMVWLEEEPGNMDKCVSIGINTFLGVWDQTTSKAEKYLEECKKRNAYAVILVEETLKDHPSTLFWLHGDEPDMPGKDGKPRTPTSKTLEEYKRIKSIEKTHPVFLNLTTKYDTKAGTEYKDVSFYRDYKDACDIISYDTYPIFGSMSEDCLWWVASAAKELRKLTDDKLPLGAVIETNAGSKWVTPSRQRHPRPYEIRCEVWMAIVNGATMICYFPHTWVDASDIGNPKSKVKRGESKYYSQYGIPEDNMAELKKINAQITKLTDVLCSANVGGKVSKEELSNGEIEIMAKENKDAMYVFAVNMKRKNEKVKFTVNGMKKGAKIEVDEENRSIEAEDGSFMDDFSEHAVHIYKIPTK